MTIENAKMMIHQIANQLTVIMGNLDLALLQKDNSLELISKARQASREASVSLRKLSHLLASIAEDTAKAAAQAAEEANRAALAAGVAVEQAEILKAAADELASRSEEIKTELNNPWIDPRRLKKK